ncbi:MAG TPA: hypothetical protein VHY30_01560 [Verrucomicrobiae bacterium]|jgi:hypothetical protein|nr:hypothetical protein [Verrucomicrobiae bacterium]
MIALNINSKRLTDIGKKAETVGRAGEVAAVAGRAVAGMLRDYLFDQDEERENKMGGARTHFYADAARSVQNPQVVGNSAIVSINQVGLAQRFFGGEIHAVNKTFLAIPARAESYGKTPGEFSDLEFVPTRTGGMLVQTLQTVITRGKRKGDFSTTTVGGLVMYWLVKSVNQLGDETVLPSQDGMAGAAADAAESYLARKLAEN